jgi:putative cardiolipin synthase
MHKAPSLLIATLLALVSGCASLPAHEPGSSSLALAPPVDAPLAQVAGRVLATGRPGDSAFRLLPEGETAFNARIAIARRAKRSIDAQYYLIRDDDVGRLFLRELRDAARRGVRVRLLVDDLYTGATEPLLAGLAAEPGAEVRLFNPLPSRGGSAEGRLLLSLHEFDRVNHRMHNKLLVADNSFAVAGGRNIAAEYFMHSDQANFIDIDVLACGQVVQDLSALFDGYWNSEHAVPVGAWPHDAAAARAALERAVAQAPAQLDERANDVLDQPPVGTQLDAGLVAMTPAPAQALADPPDKVRGVAGGAGSVVAHTLALFGTARSEVNIVSPYFIPGEVGLNMIKSVGATDENGRITLVTNALGATDEPLVHARYADYRLDLLKAGVRIYEVSPTLSQGTETAGRFGRSTGQLHAKVAVIDRQRIFIGSMNLDPRSARTNTELGLVIESPTLAEQLRALFRGSLVNAAWRLRLSADGEHIVWTATDAQGHPVVHTTEPDDTLWRRLKNWLLSPLISEDLL